MTRQHIISKKRTSLDTTNVVWHLDAGQFLLEVLANYDKAHDHYMRALSLVSNSGNDYATAKVYILIGKLYYQLGNYNNALSYYNKAIEIIPENDTSELHDEMLSTAYQYIATTYRECRKYSESINYYEKSKELIIRTYGEDSQEMAYYYSDIAILYSSMKDHEHGLEYDLKAMALFEKHKSEDNPDLASIYNSIGVQYNGCGNLEKAKLYLEKALAIKRQTLGDKHPSLATVYNNLAMMYINYNELDLAQEYFNNAARIWKTVYGEDSYRLIVLYGNIASMYESANKEKEAIKYYEMALHIAIHHYGTDDPITEEVLPSYYLALTTLAEQSPTEENKKRLEEFMADKITTCMVIDGGPASQLGLSGKCYVLEYCGWNIEDGNCMFHLVAPTAGKPKDLVLMSNNKIRQYHFEDKIGVQWLLSFIDIDKKKEIIRRYKDRKSWDN